MIFIIKRWVINVLRQTAYLMVNQLTVDNFDFLFNCTPAGQTSDSMSPYLCFISFLHLDLYELEMMHRYVRDFHANQLSKCLGPYQN